MNDYYQKLNQINTEVARLEQERRDLIDAKNKFDEEAIKSLEWTKDCIARLSVNWLVGAGLPKYTIRVYGKALPAGKHVTVLGTEALYEYNVVYSHSFANDFACGEFNTSSKKNLIAFLQKVKFKSLDYDKEALEVLLMAREIDEDR